ncbi:MAG: hypothetical protein Q9201_005866 [Fulgogasparrea decipioides]
MTDKENICVADPALRKLQSTVTTFSFFGLPKELRDLIYGLALPAVYPSRGHGRQMRYFMSDSAELPITSREHLGLFQVNRQMRSESVETFYRDATIVILVSSSYKSILSNLYFTGDLQPIELPSWTLRIRNWQVEFLGGQKTPRVGRLPPKWVDWRKNHFRDTCNFLARVTRLESLRVVFDCQAHDHSIEDFRNVSASASLREAEVQKAEKTAWFVERYAELQSLLRQLHVSKPIILNIICGTPECKRLIESAEELIGVKQPPIPRSELEACFEACKHQLKSIEHTSEWYQPYLMMWQALDMAEGFERGDPLGLRSGWLAQFWSAYGKLESFLTLESLE